MQGFSPVLSAADRKLGFKVQNLVPLWEKSLSNRTHLQQQETSDCKEHFQ